jgi:site-specific recombinase XerC
MKKTRGYVYKRGATWWLRYQHEGKRIATSLETEDEAEARAKAAIQLRPFLLNDQEAIQRQFLSLVGETQEAKKQADLELNRIKLADMWDVFVKSPARPQCGPGSLYDYQCQWKKLLDFMVSMFPDVEFMDQVAYAPHVREFAGSLTEVGGSRYNKIIRGCRLMWKIVSQYSGVPNPFEPIMPKSFVTHGKRELSEEELKKVMGMAEGEYRTLFAVGLYTALRLGDAGTVRWEDIKLPMNMVSVMPNKTQRKGKVVKIPLHPTLRAILEETPAGARKGDVMPELAAILRTSNHSPVSSAIQHLFVRAGIETQEDHGGCRKTCRVGFHSLRHSFVTICAMAGIPLPVVQEICGHGSPAIQRSYIHSGMASATAAVAAMPAMDGVKALPAVIYDARAAAADVVREHNEAAPTTAPLEQLIEAALQDAYAQGVRASK